jgi:xylulose-5-phosphate/fructose-6-phosphate phosphoketolase
MTKLNTSYLSPPPFHSFDMAVLNDLDRLHLAGDIIDRVPSLGSRAVYAKQFLRDKLLDHKAYIEKHGEDMPEILHWK